MNGPALRSPFSFGSRLRWWSGIGAAALLGAACSPAVAPAAPAAPAAATSAPAAVAPAAMATVAPPADRVVKHAMGETKVPGAPQRVITLDTGEIDSALALGVKPIGAVTLNQDGPFQAYLKSKLEGVRQVGTIAQPNLETIATLRPDLILSSKMRHDAIYTKLAQIGPTVFAERVGVTWKENLKLDAEALGKTKEADKLFADYDARLKDFKQKMGPKLATTTVSIVRSYADHIRLYQKGSFIGTILEDAGLPRPASQSSTTSTWERATRERIPDMDASVIFVMHATPDQGSQLKDIMKDPLWAQLGAVKAGQVYEVPDDTWALGIGMLAANEVTNDLFKYLAK